MSISVFLFSLFFAVIEAGLSFLVLAFAPVARLFANVPAFVLSGAIFALSMLLAWVLIIIIGVSHPRCKAADFVGDYFGRTVALALIFTLVLGVLAGGCEALYQFRPGEAQASTRASAVVDTLLTPRVVPVAEPSEIEANVRNAGGNTDAPLRFSIQWNERVLDRNDVDAHCESGSDHIYFTNKVGAQTAGELDVDIITPNAGEPAVENIVFADSEKIKNRSFRFYVHCYSYRSGTDGFRAEIEMGDQVFSYEYNTALSQDQNVDVAMVNVDAAGNMSIQHVLAPVAMQDLQPDPPAGASFADKIKEIIAFAIDSGILRCVLLAIIAFVFKLITNVCVGKNNRHFITHLLLALLTAIPAALIVEFGYRFGLPVWAVMSVFWLLLTVHILPAN